MLEIQPVSGNPYGMPICTFGGECAHRHKRTLSTDDNDLWGSKRPLSGPKKPNPHRFQRALLHFGHMADIAALRCYNCGKPMSTACELRDHRSLAKRRPMECVKFVNPTTEDEWTESDQDL